MKLYNAVNGTSYTDPEELTINTLEDAVYLSVKNDISFIICSTMNLYEHQSTFNPNMPLRGLWYFSRMYESYVKLRKEDVMGTKLIGLPTPQFIVFYNGTQDQPDDRCIKLSDAFENLDENGLLKSGGRPPALECTARMLNINYGHNQKLLESCKRLHDYSYFIAQIRHFVSRGDPLKEALEKACDFCIENDILRDILIKCREEMFQMILAEYTWENHLKYVRRDAAAEGIAEGKVIGMIEAILELLEDLGEIPENLRNKIETEQDLDVLRAWHKSAAKADSISEFREITKL